MCQPVGFEEATIPLDQVSSPLALTPVPEGVATSASAPPITFAQRYHLLERALELVHCAVTIKEGEHIIYQNRAAMELAESARTASPVPHMVLRSHELALPVPAHAGSETSPPRMCSIVTRAVLGVDNPIARRALEAVPNALWATTKDGFGHWCNHELTQNVGPTAEEFRDKDWRCLVHPDDLPRLEAEFEAARATGTPIDIEYRLQYKVPGQYHHCLIRGAPLKDDQGRVLQWVGVATDLQHIKELERQLANERALFLTALDQLPLALIIAVAPSGKIRLCNKKAAQLWGRELLSLDAEVGLPNCLQDYERWSASHPGTDKAYTAAEWPLARSIVYGEVVANEEATFTRVDGSVGIVRMSSAPVRNGDGAITAGLLICEDITQHRRLQEEQARLLAVEAAAEQSRALVSNVSHELRTPLNGIIGVSSLLAESDLSEEQAEYVQVIHESSKLLLTVIGDILDFSRIEAGKLTLESIPFSPTAVVQHVMALMAQIAAEKGVDMQLRVAADVPLCVIGDPERLKQCLFNLCSNAVKFTPANGSVTLTCVTRPDAVIATGAGGSSGAAKDTRSSAAAAGAGSSPPPVCLQFSVRDTGLGMSAEGMARCFKPFAQADVSTTRRFGGTGLGLAITRQLVTLMGGEVGVESEEGCGSTFTFTVRVGACTPAQTATLAGDAGVNVNPIIGGAVRAAAAAGTLIPSSSPPPSFSCRYARSPALASMASGRRVTPPIAGSVAATAGVARRAAGVSSPMVASAAPADSAGGVRESLASLRASQLLDGSAFAEGRGSDALRLQADALSVAKGAELSDARMGTGMPESVRQRAASGLSASPTWRGARKPPSAALHPILLPFASVGGNRHGTKINTAHAAVQPSAAAAAAQSLSPAPPEVLSDTPLMEGWSTSVTSPHTPPASDLHSRKDSLETVVLPTARAIADVYGSTAQPLRETSARSSDDSTQAAAVARGEIHAALRPHASTGSSSELSGLTPCLERSPVSAADAASDAVRAGGAVPAFKLGVTTAAQTTVHVDGALHIAKQASPLLRDARTPSAALGQQATRILLAEDNAVNAMIAKRFLRNLGYPHVTLAENGQEAVEAVQRDHFHLVLMDCQMPVMDGYEATRRIRALPDPVKRAVPIIALTASALQDDVHCCMAAGMNDHLSKPYDVPALAQKLNALLPVDERCRMPTPHLRRSVSTASSGDVIPSDPACGAVDAGPSPPLPPQPAQTGNFAALPLSGAEGAAAAHSSAASFDSMDSGSVHGR